MASIAGQIVRPRSEPPPVVSVFCPLPMLTVTVEPHGNDETRIHLHAGGQGVWIARMVRRLDVDVELVGCLGGESGEVAQLLITAEGIAVTCVPLNDDSPAYVHDRRGGEREVVAEERFPVLERHAIDSLYSATLASALAAKTCVLAGVSDPLALEDETFRRLASDLRANGVTVIADLSGCQLEAALEGGISSLKVSHEELERMGLLAAGSDRDAVVDAAKELRAMGADDVVVSRAHDPTIASIEEDWFEVRSPEMQVVDHRGAGDSMTAALAVSTALGLPRREALRLAAAAGSLNVTRHGLATGHLDAIVQLAERAEVVSITKESPQ